MGFGTGWGASAQSVINQLSGGNIAAIVILALVVTGVAAFFDWHPQAYKAFFGILFIGILIAGAAWLVNAIPGLA